MTRPFFLLHAKGSFLAQHTSRKGSVCKRHWANASIHLISLSFTIDSVVHGYHVYKDIWTSERGEELQCQCEARCGGSNVFPLCNVEPCIAM